MPTRFERVYKQIKTELEDIKSTYHYSTLSMAFAHLMLKDILEINDDDANEAITDGFNDNGIDAIFFDTRGRQNEVHFFQFKFPESEEKIAKAVTQDELLKLTNGYKLFMGNDDKFESTTWNDLLLEKRKDLLSLNGETDRNIIHIVRYTTSGINNTSYMDEEIKSLKSQTGNDIICDYKFADEIAKIYEKSKQNSWPDFTIKFKKDLSSFEDSSSKVLSYYVSLYSLYTTIKELTTDIFDGNVRYFDSSSKVNAGIKETLSSDECTRFHLLNNGITIVCSNAKTNTPTDQVIIKKGSIINGAQTVGCIIDVISQFEKEGKSIDKFKDSFIFVRVIEIEDKKELVDELVFTLNTQNQMKTSYSISNDPQVKSVQTEINSKTKYFLQVKNNEFNHVKATDPECNKLVKDIIDIETGIQAFVAYENIDGFAYLTKNNKAALFNEDNRTKIVNELTADKLLESYELYLKIMDITRSYRAYRKDSNKDEILRTLGIEQKSINNYRFINTGNFVILFALGVFCRKNNCSPNAETIIQVINFIMPIFKCNNNTSNLTKTKESFDKVEELILKKR